MNRVLLLHGFTGAPSSWDEVRRCLSPELEVTAPWLTGHGLPAAALHPRSFEEEVDRLASLMPPGTLVAGYSLGARLALGLLIRHPGHFSAAVLVSGSAGLRDPEDRRARQLSDDKWCELLEHSGLAEFVDAWQRQPLFASQSQWPEAQRDTERQRRLDHSPTGLAHSLRVAGLGRMPDYLPLLKSVEAPVEVLVGGLDQRFCAIGAEIVGKLPHAHYREVKGASHNLLLERPDVVAAAIARGSSR